MKNKVIQNKRKLLIKNIIRNQVSSIRINRTEVKFNKIKDIFIKI